MKFGDVPLTKLPIEGSMYTSTPLYGINPSYNVYLKCAYLNINNVTIVTARPNRERDIPTVEMMSRAS